MAAPDIRTMATVTSTICLKRTTIVNDNIKF